MRRGADADIAAGARLVLDDDGAADGIAKMLVRIRAMMSVGPAGANGTMILMVRSG